MKRHIPNLLTLCNLLSGCVGIVLLFRINFPAAHFVWIACVFDFLDGMVARWLKVTSPLGKELDSLSDVVSFGVLPSLSTFILLEKYFPESILPYTAFLLVAASALRLAIFNTDESQQKTFRGLPTPANALFISSLPLLPANWAPSGIVVIGIVLLFSYLLVGNFRLFSLKLQGPGWSANKVQFTFLLLSVLSFIVLKFQAVPVVILLYIGISLVWQKKLS